jgi:hypothetical protein
MFKYILENAGDINWMAIFALITFMALFIISVAVLFFYSPAYFDKMSNLPFEDNHPLTSETSDRHE